MKGPVQQIVAFKLAQHELLSGEPVFYIPYDAKGNVSSVDQSVRLEGYTFNCGNTGYPCNVPCGTEDWDLYAVCLSTGRLGKAIVALDCSADLMATSNAGWFTRYPVTDLVWEVTVG